MGLRNKRHKNNSLFLQQNAYIDESEQGNSQFFFCIIIFLSLHFVTIVLYMREILQSINYLPCRTQLKLFKSFYSLSYMQRETETHWSFILHVYLFTYMKEAYFVPFTFLCIDKPTVTWLPFLNWQVTLHDNITSERWG